MSASKSCSKCGRRMEEGFLVDAGDHNGPNVGGWHRGKPDKRWWGLKVNKAERLTITSWRCTSCGLLENYAQ